MSQNTIDFNLNTRSASHAEAEVLHTVSFKGAVSSGQTQTGFLNRDDQGKGGILSSLMALFATGYGSIALKSMLRSLTPKSSDPAERVRLIHEQTHVARSTLCARFQKDFARIYRTKDSNTREIQRLSEQLYTQAPLSSARFETLYRLGQWSQEAPEYRKVVSLVFLYNGIDTLYYQYGQLNATLVNLKSKDEGYKALNNRRAQMEKGEQALIEQYNQLAGIQND